MVTIITVVYNGEKTIRQTLNSVCNQSVLPDEYIIVDGKSTDLTLNILEEYKSQYPFIKVISEKDSGIYDAMNKGIKMAKGELIGILNSDDWYEPHAVEKMLNSYRKNGSGVYYGIQRNLLDEKEFYLERVHQDFLAKKMIQHPSSFISSDVYKKHGVFNLKYKYSADLELFIRFYDQKVSFFHLDDIITNFRIGGASSSVKAAKESLTIRYHYRLIGFTNYFRTLVKLSLKSILKN